MVQQDQKTYVCALSPVNGALSSVERLRSYYWLQTGPQIFNDKIQKQHIINELKLLDLGLSAKM